MPAYRTVLSSHGFPLYWQELRCVLLTSHRAIIPDTPENHARGMDYFIPPGIDSSTQPHAEHRSRAMRFAAFSRRVRVLSQKHAQYAALKRGYATSRQFRENRRIGQSRYPFSSNSPCPGVRQSMLPLCPAGIVPPEPRGRAVWPFPAVAETNQPACP